MWTIPNKHALPSLKEVQTTKLILSQLETRLADAIEALELAHRVIDGLEEELEERRRWIAPARLLPHDILSIIFTDVCLINWRATFILNGVCRTWRQSMIEVPHIST